MNVYLNFNGNTEDAMNFYKEALGGTIVSLQRFGDTPMPSSDDYKNKVMHGVMHISGVTVMFSDSTESKNVTFGNNFSLALDFDNDGDLERAFAAISTGGIVTMPAQDTFWGAKFGMCTDKFGVNWMVNYDKPKQS